MNSLLSSNWHLLHHTLALVLASSTRVSAQEMLLTYVRIYITKVTFVSGCILNRTLDDPHPEYTVKLKNSLKCLYEGQILLVFNLALLPSFASVHLIYFGYPGRTKAKATNSLRRLRF